ncbi:MAG: pentapeptide repeat-containing protein [Myxococcota bacterium]
MARPAPTAVLSARDAAALARGPAEYEATTFRDCDLTGADLGKKRFVDCVFEASNLSTVEWRGAALHGVRFRECKLLGADLTRVRTTFLALTFEACKLDYANFGGLELVKTLFDHCSLVDASFVGTNLSGAVFSDCDVSGALFRQTNLSGADLRGADGLVLDPEQNRIRKAKLSLHGLPGLLTKYELDVD